MELNKRKILIASTIILTLTVNTPAWASPLDDQLSQQKQQLQQSQSSYNNIETQIEQSEITLEKMDEQIMSAMDDIKATNDKIAQKKLEIANTEKEIQTAKDNIKSEEDLYKQRIRAMYISDGANGYLEVLLDSTSFSDFISRFEEVTAIMNFDKKLLNDYREKEKQISTNEQSLLKQKDSLLALQASNQKQLDELNSTKDKQKQVLAQLKKQESQNLASINKYKALIYQTYNQIHGNQSSTSGKTSTSSTGAKSSSKPAPSRGTSAAYSSNAVVAYAMDFLGTPYVYGGSTPAGFDCSGFTKFVFARFGITLNRVSRDQANQGTPVSRDSLQPGDLVFFGSPVYHVGIYAGNGLMVHAPHTGDVVKIAPVMWSSFSSARRMR